MTNTLDQLDKALQKSVERIFPSEAPAGWGRHECLAERNRQLFLLFEENAIPEPPREQRLRALRKLYQQAPLDRKDWRLISWGLNDAVADREPVLEDAAAYRVVHQHFANEIRNKRLPRKCWFGLANGYFGYANSTPQENPHWQQLAELLIQGFELLSRQQRRERPWVTAIRGHLELFSHQPGVRLAKALAEGDQESWQALQKHLPIPENSWLWRRIIEAHLAHVTSLDDEAFRQKIPSTLHLAETRPAYVDGILAALLTRYTNSRDRDRTENQLRDLALQKWGNPQIGQRVGRWEQHVGDDVRRMVLKWFARDDLIHFFSLLQGESQVDQNRLNYWMRFVGQMAYTRVVLGAGAQANRSPEFLEFRQKNKGRYSNLAGGTREDNAFIMQIGHYYFVEFSKKGNACYYYDSQKSGESLLANTLEMYRLKSHLGDKFNHMSGWESKTDSLLAHLGIYPDVDGIATAALPHRSPLVESAADARKRAASIAPPPAANVVTRSLSPSAKQQPPSAVSPRHPVVEQLIIKARHVIQSCQSEYPVLENDMRDKGGAFWFETEHRDTVVAWQLKKLGFSYRDGRGYWIK